MHWFTPPTRCALCHEKATCPPDAPKADHVVLRDPHIIPAGIFDRVKSKAAQAMGVSLIHLVPSGDGPRTGYTKSDEYTEYLLCHDCEEHLCQDEKKAVPYFAFSDGRFPLWIEHLGRVSPNSLGVLPVVIPETVNVEALSRMALMILWRASVAQQPVFRRIKLPADDEEACRLALLNGGWPRHVHLQLTALTDHDGGRAQCNVILPTQFDFETRAYIHFMLCGVFFTFDVMADDPVGWRCFRSHADGEPSIGVAQPQTFLLDEFFDSLVDANLKAKLLDYVRACRMKALRNVDDQ